MGDENAIDFNGIARKIQALPSLVRPGDRAKVAVAIEGLRGLPFPPGYLDETLGAMMCALGSGVMNTKTSVYLAFYGLDSASHMKVGIAGNVKNRLSNIKTGNPLPLLWAFSSEFHSRDTASQVERCLLGHLCDRKVHGEWISVCGISGQASDAMVKSLAEVATSFTGWPVEFGLVQI